MTTPLKTARKISGMTAMDLAAICGTSEQRLYAIERGRFRPRIDEAEALAEVLNIPVAQLFPAGVQPGAGDE